MKDEDKTKKQEESRKDKHKDKTADIKESRKDKNNKQKDKQESRKDKQKDKTSDIKKTRKDKNNKQDAGMKKNKEVDGKVKKTKICKKQEDNKKDTRKSTKDMKKDKEFDEKKYAKDVKTFYKRKNHEKKEESTEKNDVVKKKKYPTNTENGNMFIISNLSYKETEESIKECLSAHGVVESVKIQKNKEGKPNGKATVCFESYIRINEDVILNGKHLRFERAKHKEENDTRIFVSKINRNLSILEIRNILKEAKSKPADIRAKYENNNNPGYCHLTYKNKEEAKKFESAWTSIRDKFGKEACYAYSIEKTLPNKNRRNMNR